MRRLVPILFLILLAGAAAALVFVDAQRSRSNVLDSALVTPSFAPGGRGAEQARIRFRVSEPEPSASVEVTRGDGSLVRRVAGPEPLSAGAVNRYAWDGRTDAGEPAPAGLYSIRVLLGEQDRAIYLPQRTRLVRGPAEPEPAPAASSGGPRGQPGLDDPRGTPPLGWLALLTASAAAAFALVTAGGGAPGGRRARLAAFAIALALATVLVVDEVRGSFRFDALGDDLLPIFAAGAAAALLVGVLGVAIARWPGALALLTVATLAFRVPVEIGGRTSNLVLQFYLVIAAGLVAAVIRPPPDRGDESRPGSPGDRPWTRRLRWALAAFLVLYALQAAHSGDFPRAVENACLFFIPFAALFVLLAELEWSRRLVLAVAVAVAVEVGVLALVALVEAGTRELIWINPAVEAGNQIHAYFRVNSLLWDPNILGRYLALGVIVVGAALLWTRSRRLALGSAGFALVLLAGLAFTYSLSSLVALGAGLAVLAGARWGFRWGLAVCAAGAIAAGALVALGEFPSGSGDDPAGPLDERTSGRTELVSGGLELARDGPFAGHGSGSFELEFGSAFGSAYDEPYAGPGTGEPLTTSHTEVVTVAAEQGLLGLAALTALLVTAFAALLPGRRSAAGAAVLAGFTIMFVHSFAYDAFLIDAVTWALLAIGVALPLRERLG